MTKQTTDKLSAWVNYKLNQWLDDRPEKPTFTHAEWADAEHTYITCTLWDGTLYHVPVAFGNRHFRALIIEDVTVHPYSSPNDDGEKPDE